MMDNSGHVKQLIDRYDQVSSISKNSRLVQDNLNIGINVRKLIEIYENKIRESKESNKEFKKRINEKKEENKPEVEKVFEFSKKELVNSSEEKITVMLKPQNVFSTEVPEISISEVTTTKTSADTNDLELNTSKNLENVLANETSPKISEDSIDLRINTIENTKEVSAVEKQPEISADSNGLKQKKIENHQDVTTEAISDPKSPADSICHKQKTNVNSYEVLAIVTSSEVDLKLLPQEIIVKENAESQFSVSKETPQKEIKSKEDLIVAITEQSNNHLENSNLQEINQSKTITQGLNLRTEVQESSSQTIYMPYVAPSGEDQQQETREQRKRRLRKMGNRHLTIAVPH